MEMGQRVHGGAFLVGPVQAIVVSFLFPRVFCPHVFSFLGSYRTAGQRGAGRPIDSARTARIAGMQGGFEMGTTYEPLVVAGPPFVSDA